MNPILPQLDVKFAAYHHKADFRVYGCIGFYAATILSITILAMGILSLTRPNYLWSDKVTGYILVSVGALGTAISFKGAYEASARISESKANLKNYLNNNFVETECRFEPYPDLPGHYRVWRPGQNAAGQPEVHYLNMLVTPMEKENRLHIFEDFEAVDAYVKEYCAPTS